MVSSEILLLCLLVIIALSAEEQVVSTKPFLTAYWGKSVELPCQISRPPYTVFWYQHISTGAPDEDSRIVVQNINGEDIASAEPRFEITSNFSLITHNVTVQDETTYSCRVAWPNNQMTSYTHLRVVALADELTPIVVENCRKNGTYRCVYYIAPSESTIQLRCEAIDVWPSVNLTWTNALTGEVVPSGRTEERVDKETGLVTVSRVTPITGSDIGQERMCQAKGKAVRGTTSYTVLLRKEPQENPSPAGRSSAPAVMVAVVILLITLVVVGLTIAGVWWYRRKELQKDDKQQSIQDEETVPLKSKIEKQRELIRDYVPGKFSNLDIPDGVELPSRVKIHVIGVTCAGKSLFIRSLYYAFHGTFETSIEVVGPDELMSGGITLKTNSYKLTESIIMEDNRGLKDLDPSKDIPQLFESVRSRGVHGLVLVHSSTQPISALNGFLSELNSKNRDVFGSHPILVLTHRDMAEEQGMKDSIRAEAKTVGAQDEKLFFIENFTERLDEDDPEREVRTLEFLEVFLKLLHFADDNLVWYASGAVSSPEANTEGGDGIQQNPGRFKDFFKRKLKL